jgi:hypothetical protein
MKNPILAIFLVFVVCSVGHSEVLLKLFPDDISKSDSGRAVKEIWLKNASVNMRCSDSLIVDSIMKIEYFDIQRDECGYKMAGKRIKFKNSVIQMPTDSDSLVFYDSINSRLFKLNIRHVNRVLYPYTENDKSRVYLAISILPYLTIATIYVGSVLISGISWMLN